MTATKDKPHATPDELAADAFVCVNCGAPVTFRASDDAADQSELEQAACPYCSVVNDRALAKLRKQRARERHDERATLARRSSTRRLAAAAVAAILLLSVLAAFNTRGELSALDAEVQSTHAQLANVRERQIAVVKRYEAASPGPDRDAELSGAENRVRIERARHDKAAAAYNAMVGSPWARLCASLFGLPNRAPLSDEQHW